MNMRMGLVWGVVVWSISFAGCSVTSPRPATHHYVLTLAVPDTSGPRISSLVVRSIGARDPYNQERIVYRSSAYAFDLYNYHRWASTPAEQVTTWTRRVLRGSGLFAQVLPNTEGTADFILDGTIQQFEEIDHEKTWEAALSIDFWLMRPGDRTPVWFQSYSVIQQAPKRNPEAIAEAMSRALETVLGRLTTDLAPVVSQRMP
jgi:ABC-type uncharacterized transport system auxiliary subunit